MPITHYDIQKKFAKVMKSEGLMLAEHRIPGKYLGFCVITEGYNDMEYLQDLFEDFPLSVSKVAGKYRYYPDKGITELEMEDLYDTYLA